MVCLRCGRELPRDGAFCQACLLDMERDPVASGTPVVLPQRGAHQSSRRPPKRRGPSPEEQIRALKRRVRVLSVLALVFFLLAAALAFPAWRHLRGQQLRPGQNYSSVVSTQESTG